MNIGDKVIYTSGEYGSHEDNPLHKDYPDVIGTVIGRAITKGWWVVQWSNGKRNSYLPEDLDSAFSYQDKIAKHYNV